MNHDSIQQIRFELSKSKLKPQSKFTPSTLEPSLDLPTFKLDFVGLVASKLPAHLARDLISNINQ